MAVLILYAIMHLIFIIDAENPIQPPEWGVSFTNLGTISHSATDFHVKVTVPSDPAQDQACIRMKNNFDEFRKE